MRGLSQFAVALTAAALASVVPGGAAAENVLERIERTGVLRAGTRDNIPPFATRGADGAFEGFSVAIIKAIHEAVQARLQRRVTLELAEVGASSRIEAVAAGELDITCDIASPTWAREEVIDFSLSIFFNGTRVMVKRDAIHAGLQDLEAPRIGVLSASATIRVIDKALPGAEIIEFADMNAALTALENGQLDGISNISIILRDLQRRAEQPGQYVLLPRSGYLNAEPMACVLPQDDSAWRDLVNRTIAGMLDGVDDYRGPYYEVYRQWFGPEAQLHYPLSRDAINHFRQIRIWLDN